MAPNVTIDNPPNKPSIPSTILNALIAPKTANTVTGPANIPSSKFPNPNILPTSDNMIPE